jgi:hypothetical protein
MTKLSISSIFKNNEINETTPFIIIKISNDTDNIITKKYETSELEIYYVDYTKLRQKFIENKIPKYFYVVSNSFITHKKHSSGEIKILLVNSTLSICKRPAKFEKMIKIGNGYIWRPINITCPRFYKCIGFVYSNKYPTNNECMLIDSEYLKHSNEIIGNVSVENIITSNEYDMFVLDYDEKLTIDIQKINNSFNTLSMLQQKIYSNFDNNIETFDDTKPISKTLFHMLPEGRVEYNNKCLTINEDGNVSEIECTHSPLQEWKYSNGNIYTIPQGDNENMKQTKCLNDDLTLSPCDISQEGKNVDLEEPDVRFPNTMKSDCKWHKKYGKNVVLVSSDDPWYVNKESNIPMKVVTQKNDDEFSDYSKPYGLFSKTNIKKINAAQPDVGVEGFDMLSHKSQIINPYTLLLLSLLLIFVIQIWYIVCHKTN